MLPAHPSDPAPKDNFSTMLKCCSRLFRHISTSGNLSQCHYDTHGRQHVTVDGKQHINLWELVPVLPQTAGNNTQ